MIAWARKWWGHALVAIAAIAAMWASFHRGQQAKHVTRAREAKRDNLDAARLEERKADRAAARANVIIETQRQKLNRLEDHADATVADRARALNERMRRAAESSRAGH